ncbi:MAG: amino acid permease [Candidatus Auribacterota bacterium]|nr:amino acid permease [Candidatus Auribacterota bacterium]
MASLWSGGIYIWTRRAFGERWGFIAIWFQWISAVVWFPTVLSFIAATVAYIFNPALAENKFFVLIVVLSIYWLATLGNFLGMKEVGWVSTLGICSTMIIAGVIIVLGAIWIIQGNPSQITFAAHDLFPDFSRLENLVFLAGVMVIIWVWLFWDDA